jgi:inward rectifier potassium channel
MLRRRRDRPEFSQLGGALRRDRALRVRPIGLRRVHPGDFYHALLRLSWPQVTLLFVCSFSAFNLFFAWLYWLDPNGIERGSSLLEGSRFWHCFFFSVQTVATIGYGNLYPVTTYANILVVIEITLGILFFALVTGIAFARFSRPKARVLFSRVAVIHDVDGTPTLMFRTANLRHNLIFEARATVSVLMDEQVGGTVLRRFKDLSLVRDANPVFTLTWMIMHPIDEHSPLVHWCAGQEPPAHSEIVVVLSGMDDRTGQMMHGRWAYSASDVRWNAQFVDILDQLPDGTRTIDYRRFHDIEPV